MDWNNKHKKIKEDSVRDKFISKIASLSEEIGSLREENEALKKTKNQTFVLGIVACVGVNTLSKVLFSDINICSLALDGYL